VDAARSDPFAHDGSRRTLLVRFWYPTVPAQGCTPAEYSSPKVWAYLSTLTGVPAFPVSTNSCWQAPPALGTHPVIIATHGYTGTATDYTFIFEDLASRGYVVASVAHTYEATAVEFSDGRLITSVFGSHFVAESLRTDEQSLAFARSVRLRDLGFVIRELGKINSASGSPFYQRFDLGRMGILGHSLGGEAALASMEQQSALKAGALLDAVISPASSRGTDKPILILAEGRQSWGELECTLWNNLRGPRLAVNFEGAEHLTPSDAIWLGAYLPSLRVKPGSIGPAQTITAVRRYLAAFFDTYLSGKPRSSLLNGVSADYANAVVTTSRQSMCTPVETGPQQGNTF
jgi:dienelactone hydrolase